MAQAFDPSTLWVEGDRVLGDGGHHDPHSASTVRGRDA